MRKTRQQRYKEEMARELNDLVDDLAHTDASKVLTKSHRTEIKKLLKQALIAGASMYSDLVDETFQDVRKRFWEAEPF